MDAYPYMVGGLSYAGGGGRGANLHFTPEDVRLKVRNLELPEYRSLKYRVHCNCITHKCLNLCSKKKKIYQFSINILFRSYIIWSYSQTFSVVDDVIVFVLSAENGTGYFNSLFKSFLHLVSVELND